MPLYNVHCTCTDGLLWIQETVYYIAKHNFIKTRTLARGLFSSGLNVALQVLAGCNGPDSPTDFVVWVGEPD